MKLTKEALRVLIKEELQDLINEEGGDSEWLAWKNQVQSQTSQPLSKLEVEYDGVKIPFSNDYDVMLQNIRRVAGMEVSPEDIEQKLAAEDGFKKPFLNHIKQQAGYMAQFNKKPITQTDEV